MKSYTGFRFTQVYCPFLLVRTRLLQSDLSRNSIFCTEKKTLEGKKAQLLHGEPLDYISISVKCFRYAGRNEDHWDVKGYWSKPEMLSSQRPFPYLCSTLQWPHTKSWYLLVSHEGRTLSITTVEGFIMLIDWLIVNWRNITGLCVHLFQPGVIIEIHFGKRQRKFCFNHPTRYHDLLEYPPVEIPRFIHNQRYNGIQLLNFVGRAFCLPPIDLSLVVKNHQRKQITQFLYLVWHFALPMTLYGVRH